MDFAQIETYTACDIERERLRAAEQLRDVYHTRQTLLTQRLRELDALRSELRSELLIVDTELRECERRCALYSL